MIVLQGSFCIKIYWSIPEALVWMCFRFIIVYIPVEVVIVRVVNIRKGVSVEDVIVRQTG